MVRFPSSWGLLNSAPGNSLKGIRLILQGIRARSLVSRFASSIVSFTPASITYSMVIFPRGGRGYFRQASRRDSKGYFRLMGTRMSRISFVVAHRETANFTSEAAPNFSISGTKPEVETVTFLLEKFRQRGSTRI